MVGRTEYRCAHCGVNLGTNPWLGLPDEPHTKCGCFPSKEQKMIARPTQQEKIQAILDARQPVAEFLQSIGKIEVFNDFTRDDIAGLIRAAVDGFQDSLLRQCGEAFDDNSIIPF